MIEIIHVPLITENGDWDEFDFELLDQGNSDDDGEPWIGEHSRIAQVTEREYKALQRLSDASSKLHSKLCGLHQAGAGSMEIFNETKGAGA